MSAIIFDQKEQLLEPLLPPGAGAGSDGRMEAEREVAGGWQLPAEELEASASNTSLDNSRRTMNSGQGREERRERLFSGHGVVVELSNTGSHTASRTKGRPLSYYGESVNGSEDEEEEEDDEDLLGAKHVSQLVLNRTSKSYRSSTLPRPFNPGYTLSLDCLVHVCVCCVWVFVLCVCVCTCA